MTAFSSFSNAGIACIQVSIVDSTGCPMGITGTLAPDTGAAGKIMQFSKRFGGAAPQPVRATAIGDNNRSRHEYIFNAPNMGEIQFLFAALDLDAYTGFTKTKKVTVNNSNYVGLQTNAPANAAQAVIVVNIDAQDADAGEFGLKRYINEIYSLVTVAPTLANIQEVQAAEWGYFGVPTQAGQLPWGVPFTTATNGFVRAGGIVMTSDYPLVVETFLAGAGSPTTYDLTYTPATPDSTYVNAWDFATGTPVAVNVTDRTETFTALGNGDKLVTLYEATDLLNNL